MKFDQDLCLNLQYDFGKMNSTLGSVVPLAMFLQYFYAHRIYDISPLFGFGDNASGCCAQSVLFPKQKLSNSLVAAGWVVPSVPVGQMHFQDGRSLH